MFVDVPVSCFYLHHQQISPTISLPEWGVLLRYQRQFKNMELQQPGTRVTVSPVDKIFPIQMVSTP